MTTSFERPLSGVRSAGDSPPGDFDEERSIGAALRVTLLFVAIVVLLLWAGASDAASPALPISARPLGQPAPLCLAVVLDPGAARSQSGTGVFSFPARTGR
jgi:hypothetical protein